MRPIPTEVQHHVPAWVARRAAETALPEDDSPTAERFPAAAMIVDVSGFTSLGERLAERGHEGAEILWRVVNGFFDAALKVVHAHGGDVLRFAGDAPIVLWPATTAAPIESVTLRATQCGMALQRALGNYDTGQDTSVRFRVAITAGDAVAALVGGVDGRWEPIVGGHPFDDLESAADLADVGEVVLSRRAFQLVEQHATGEPLSAGCWRVHRVVDFGKPVAIEFPTLALTALDRLRGCVSPAIVERLAAGHGSWLGELREVTTVFVSIPGLDYGSDGVEMRLHDVLKVMQRAVYQYQGTINQFLVDDKGTILLAAWGVPGSTHEGDPSLAVRASLELHRALERRGILCSIGISTGRIFCGVKGNRQRSEYGLLGSRVNLAARLMQQARGEILCDDETVRHAEGSVSFAAPLSVQLKGHAAPLNAFRPRRATDGPTLSASGSMVARDQERQALVQQLDALVDGRGGAVLVEGEAGIGKSKLIEFLEGAAVQRGLAPLVGGADNIEHRTPYFAFQPIFATIFGLTRELEPEERVYAALNWFEQHASFRPLSPLFNPVLRLSLPDNSTTSVMEGEARAETARSAFVRVLGQTSPLLVIIEDIHWLDSASFQLAQTAMRELPEALFVFSTRPPGEKQAEAYSRLKELPELVHIELEPLRREDIEALVCRRLGVERLAREVGDMIWERAGGGYPFYSEELASALLDEGAIVRSDGVARLEAARGAKRLALPATLQGVIASRLDRLSPVELLSLKTASVIGRSFTFAMVSGIYPIPELDTRVRDALEVTCQRNLTERASNESARSYLFKHVITQEVAYEHLLFGQRLELHVAAARWYEEGKSGPVEPTYPLIAYHYERAGKRERAIEALERAGTQALAAFANREALDFMTRAAALDAEGSPSTALRRSRWARIEGEAYSRLGMISDSVRALSQAMGLMGYSLPRPGVMTGVHLLGQMGRQIWRRYFGLPTALKGERQLILDAVNTFGELGLMAWYNSDLPLMLYTTFKALNLAERVGPSPEVARLKAALAVMMAGVPMHATAEKYAQEAIETAEQFEHGQSTARAHQYYAAFLIGMGRWDEVEPHTRSARAASTQIGNDRGVEEATNAEIYGAMAQSRDDEVLEKADMMSSSASRREDHQVIFWTNIHRAEVKWLKGLYVDAQAVLDDMDPEGEDDTTVVKRYWGLRTHVCLARGDLDRAIELVASHLMPQQRPATFVESRAFTAVAATELARWEDRGAGEGAKRAARKACGKLVTFASIYPQGAASARYYSGQYERLAGRRAKAHRWFSQSLAIAQARGERHDEMLAHEALGSVSEGDERDAHLTAWEALREALGNRG